MRARDVMTAGVVAVSTHSPIEQVARVLRGYGISSVPVIDGRNAVVGLIREEDLFVRERTVPFSRERVPALLDESIDLHRLPEVYAEVRGRTAGEVMRSEPIFVDADEEVAEIVRRMLVRGCTKVFVRERGELAGVISRADLVGLLAGSDLEGRA